MIYIISDRTNGGLYRALTTLYNEHRSEEDKYLNGGSTMTNAQLIKILRKYLKTNKVRASEDAIDIYTDFIKDNNLSLTNNQENECYKEIEFYQVNLD